MVCCAIDLFFVFLNLERLNFVPIIVILSCVFILFLIVAFVFVVKIYKTTNLTKERENVKNLEEIYRSLAEKPSQHENGETV